MVVTDTSSRPEDQQVVDLVLQTSDVVVVCFDATRQPTLDSIRSSWYPRIQRLNPDVPVIMACCKADRLGDEREVAMLRERVERAVHDLPHVEVCLNCSARTLRMVADVFFYALKSVLYPLQPLYDRLEKRLRPLCVRALKRVFMTCDCDGDGALSDAELNGFQLTCFGMALDEGELQNVKQIVASKMPSGVSARGISLEGFLFLHVLFIERGRLESTWAVLRKFGYNDTLTLSDEVLDRVNFSLPHDQVWELSDTAAEFLARTFAAYDDDGDGLVSWQQLDAMFSTIPPPVWQGEPWSRLLVPGVYGAAHRLEAFLAKWRFGALMDPRTTYAHLLYLGAGGPDGTAAIAGGSGPGGNQLLVRGTRRRVEKRHRGELAARSTLQCFVFGARGAGKTSLLRAFVGQRPALGPSDTPGAAPGTPGGGATNAGLAAPSSPGGPLLGSIITESPSAPGAASPTPASSAPQPPLQLLQQHQGVAASGSGLLCAANAVRGPDEKVRTLVLQEVSEAVVAQVLTAAALTAAVGPPLVAGQHQAVPELHQADVAAFVFDSSSPDSFRAARALMEQVSTLAGATLPCVLVAAKDELVMSAALEAEVAQAVADMRIPGPLRVSAEEGSLGNLFPALVGAAIAPDGWVPETEAAKARKRLLKQAALGVGAAVVAAGAAYGVYRLLSGPSSTTTTTSTATSSTTASRTPTAGSTVPAASGSSSSLSSFFGGSGTSTAKAYSVMEAAESGTATAGGTAAGGTAASGLVNRGLSLLSRFWGSAEAGCASACTTTSTSSAAQGSSWQEGGTTSVAPAALACSALGRWAVRVGRSSSRVPSRDAQVGQQGAGNGRRGCSAAGGGSSMVVVGACVGQGHPC